MKKSSIFNKFKIKLYIKVCFFWLLLQIPSKFLIAAEPSGSDATISGYVIDVKTGETLVGATIEIKELKIGSFTNKSGFFSITSIPPGAYDITVTYIGYKKQTIKMKFKLNENVRKQFKLEPVSITTESISVEADRDVEKREITVSKIDVPIQQIKEIRIGGESDVFRSLQYIPGILTSSQISSGLYIWGGSPDENLVLVDGSVVYNPTHLFGFISTFNSDAIKDVELIKGGYPAEYGGRLSSVLNITQKDGNRNNFDGMAGVGIISSKLSLEGPLFNGSWFVGGRRTYLELIKAIIPKDPLNPLPDYNFYDLNAKVTQNFGNNDKLFVSGFMSADALSYNSFGTNFNMNIGNKLISGRWTHIFGGSLFTTLNLSGSHYQNEFIGDESGYQFIIDNTITDYTLKGSAEWFVSEMITSKFGFESTRYLFDYLQNYTGQVDSTVSGTSGGAINLAIRDWNHSFYGQINYRITDLLSLQTGLRANYWDMRKVLTWDPRLAIRYQFQDNIAFKAAWGIYHQNLRLASQPDFSFFDTWLPTDSTAPISSAVHYIFSIESEPFDGYGLNFDVYYKKMYNINEINTNTIEGANVADIFYFGNADSYGADIFLQKKFGRLTGWVGYALGYIYAKFDSINNGQEFRPKYDRRHDFKIVVQYKYNDRWEFGGSFIFQSGQSYTGATSRLQSRLPDDNYGRGMIIPSQRYGLRLPPSHQLNLNASYSLKLFDMPSRVILDIYNVYDRRDIWFRYYNTRNEVTTVEDVRLLPILPSLSFEMKF